MITPAQSRVLLRLQEAEDRGEKISMAGIAGSVELRAKSRVHRVLQSLVERGWVRQDKRHGPYKVIRRIPVLIPDKPDKPILSGPAEYFIWDEDSKALVPFKGREAA